MLSQRIPWTFLRDDRFGKSAIALSTTVSVQLLGVATGVLVARVLGPTERGQLALLMLLPTILGFLGDLGTDRATIFFSAQSESRTTSLPLNLIKLGLPLAIGATLVAAVLSIAILRDQPQNVRLIAIVASCCVPLSIFSRYGQALLQGQLKMARLGVARLSEPLVYLGIMLALASGSALTLLGAVMARLVAQFGVIGISWHAALKDSSAEGQPVDLRKELVSYGLRGFPVKLSPNDTFQLDQWLVGLTLGAADLAYYVVALAVLGPARIIPVAFGMVIVPLVAKAKRMQEVILMLIIGTFASGLVAIVLFLALPTVLPWLFGTAYSPAVQPAQIIAVAALPFGVRELLVSTLYGVGKPGLSSVVELGSFATLLVSLVVLLEPLGLEGVATALLLSYTAGALLAVVLISKEARRGHVLNPER